MELWFEIQAQPIPKIELSASVAERSIGNVKSWQAWSQPVDTSSLKLQTSWIDDINNIEIAEHMHEFISAFTPCPGKSMNWIASEDEFYADMRKLFNHRQFA